MKTSIFNLILALLPVICMAQPKNPYNQRGIDFIKSIQIISADFNAGVVKEINEESIRKYSKLVPLQNQAPTDMVASVVKAVKSPNFSLENTLRNSSLSEYAKQACREFCNPKKLNLADFNDLLGKKVEEINQSKITGGEKEFLLSLAAITYHTYSGNTAMMRQVCYIETTEGTSTVPCSLAGALIGAAIGLQACGPWCALGGAIVGAVIGSLS